jgi:hypothetical protein
VKQLWPRIGWIGVNQSERKNFRDKPFHCIVEFGTLVWNQAAAVWFYETNAYETLPNQNMLRPYLFFSVSLLSASSLDRSPSETRCTRIWMEHK